MEVRYRHQPWAVMEAKVMQLMGTIALSFSCFGIASLLMLCAN